MAGTRRLAADRERARCRRGRLKLPLAHRACSLGVELRGERGEELGLLFAQLGRRAFRADWASETRVDGSSVIGGSPETGQAELPVHVAHVALVALERELEPRCELTDVVGLLDASGPPAMMEYFVYERVREPRVAANANRPSCVPRR